MARGYHAFVVSEFERYLACGILANGFARVRCASCGDEMLVAFSCKGRGFCPSCTTRRMQGTATHPHPLQTLLDVRVADHAFPPLKAPEAGARKATSRVGDSSARDSVGPFVPRRWSCRGAASSNAPYPSFRLEARAAERKRVSVRA
jgi:hypothetical protein